jgi:DNA modification methylase
MQVLDQTIGQGYALYNADTCELLPQLPSDSIDLTVTSPPFSSLFTYSASDRDLGNSATREEFFEHFAFVIRELLRITKPGRNAAIHVQQIAATLAHDGFIGLTDFRGDVIRAFIAGGWAYHGEVCIDKDPQAQAIRTHAKGLLFVQKTRDASWLRPALADYILVFRKPGENAVPVVSDVSNEEWIEFARPIWYGIRESDTLNAAVAREDQDERHICPLQLGTIERCVRLWTNPGETVFEPFAGIGSVGVVALRQGRRFVGSELKPSYYRTAVRNLAAEQMQGQLDLFAAV